MKKVLTVIAGLALVFSAQADIATSYSSSYGITDSGFNPLLGVGEQALIQLIYAGADGLVDGAAQAGGALAAGDDVILLSVLGPVVAGEFDNEAYGVFVPADIGGQVNGLGIAGGLVYGRVFQDSAAAGGSFYYEGELAAMPNVNLAAIPAPTPTAYDVAPITAGAIANLQVVPEPATIGLMGIAGMGLFLARRKTRR